jgi:hypothetical protein
MAERRNAVICAAMAWQRAVRRCVAMAQQREDILLKGVNDLNDLQIFSNPEFGSIRTVKEDTAHE